MNLCFTDEETEAQKHPQRCRWDLKPALSLHICCILWSLKGHWGLSTCPGAVRKGMGQGKPPEEMPPRPGEEHRLSTCRAVWARASRVGWGQPVQRHRGVKQHSVCLGSYSQFRVTEA